MQHLEGLSTALMQWHLHRLTPISRCLALSRARGSHIQALQLVYLQRSRSMSLLYVIGGATQTRINMQVWIRVAPLHEIWHHLLDLSFKGLV